MTPFHHMGKSFPTKRSDETMIYPKPLANSNCRQQKGIIVVDQYGAVLLNATNGGGYYLTKTNAQAVILEQ
jgi:hypothetical protein